MQLNHTLTDEMANGQVPLVALCRFRCQEIHTRSVRWAVAASKVECEVGFTQGYGMSTDTTEIGCIPRNIHHQPVHQTDLSRQRPYAAVSLAHGRCQIQVQRE